MRSKRSAQHELNRDDKHNLSPIQITGNPWQWLSTFDHSDNSTV